MKKQLLFLLCLLSSSLYAQEGSVDTDFDPGDGFDRAVRDILIQADGKILAAGNFTEYADFETLGMARLNPNGSVDKNLVGLQGSESSILLALGLQSSGNILLGGNFIPVVGLLPERLLRFTADGEPDNARFDPSINATVRAIELLPDDRILIGGDFGQVNRMLSPGIAQLTPDGLIDPNLNVGTGFDGAVRTIARQTDGKILVGGDFKIYNNVNRNRLARLNPDGSLDTSFELGSGFDGLVNKVVVQSDGKMIVVGNFTSYQGIPRNRIVRLNPNGSLDQSFASGGFDDIVYDVVIQNDGKIILGGAFRSYQGIASNRIIRLLADGNFDSSFQTGGGFDNTVRVLALESSGKLLVGGAFESYNGSNAPKIVRIIAQSGITVTNTNSEGAGSLRQAIINANELPGTQTVQFNLNTQDPGYMPSPSGFNFWRIRLDNPLPVVTDPIILDGSSQAGFNGNPPIELLGNNSSNSIGIQLQAPNCEVFSLAINNFNIGVLLDGGSALVQNCRIGVQLNEGNEPAPNNTGLVMRSSSNQIDNNIIGYNTSNGIRVQEGNFNTFSQNSIFCNEGEGISLPDEGNAGVEPPSITRADTRTISGNCVIGATVEVYSNNPACGDDRQGRTLIGKGIVNRNVWSLSGNFNIGDRITAIQTGQDGTTSGFSTLEQISANSTVPAPQNLNAVAFSQSQIQLTWEDVSLSETGFELEVFNEATDGLSFINLSANRSNFLFDGNPGIRYCFRIRANALLGNSNWSNESCARPLPIPNTPSNLVASTDSLTWQDNSSNENGFEIEVKSLLSDNNFEILGEVGENQNSFPLEGLSNNILYTFRVRAFNSFGPSSYSNLDSLVIINNSDIPSPPDNLAAQSVSPSQINLSWDYLLDNTSVFVVERSLFGDNFQPAPELTYQLLNNSENTIKRLTDSQGLVENSLYCYRVRVISEGGVSIFSDTVCTPALCNLEGALVVLRNDGGVTGDVICDGRSASMEVIPEVQGASYQWQRNGNPIPGVEAQLANYLAEETGNYSCLVRLGGNCDAQTINEVLVIVQGTAPSLSIQYDGLRFQSSITDATIYQWFRDGAAISGATDITYQPEDPGAYFLVAQFGTGVGACASTSNVLIFPEVVTGEPESLSQAMQILPNPARSNIQFQVKSPLQGEYTWRLLDLQGQVLREESGKKASFDWERSIDVKGLPQGLYLLEVFLDGKRGARRLMIE